MMELVIDCRQVDIKKNVCFRIVSKIAIWWEHSPWRGDNCIRLSETGAICDYNFYIGSPNLYNVIPFKEFINNFHKYESMIGRIHNS